MSRDTRGMGTVDRVAEYTASQGQDGPMVAWWRYDRFAELGCPHEQVTRLVYAQVDWHAFEQLLKRGCDAETAEKLLAPL